jgi:sn-glycerol 3-phosphate transport system permease protein
MVQNRPFATFVSHLVLILGVAIVAFPIWITFVAATHDGVRITQVPLPLLPGDQLFANLESAFFTGVGKSRFASCRPSRWSPISAC